MDINPFPAEEFPVTIDSEELIKKWQPDAGMYTDISIAGRIMSRRIMGSASFAEMQDSKGKIQIYVKRDEICTGEDKSLYNIVFKKLLDIGDIIGVRGEVFK